jgi:hypothetical protein
MNATTPRAVGLVVLTAIVLAAARPAAAYTGQELAGDAKITIDQARAIGAESASGPDHRRGTGTRGRRQWASLHVWRRGRFGEPGSRRGRRDRSGP